MDDAAGRTAAARPVSGGAPAKGHEVRPWPDSVYSVDGPNAGQQANLMNSHHYPVEGICVGCGQMIRSGTFPDTWRHTGRMPGDPP